MCAILAKMQYSSEEISIDEEHFNVRRDSKKGLKYLPHWPAVNIEFQDLVYTVPDISGELLFSVVQFNN